MKLGKSLREQMYKPKMNIHFGICNKVAFSAPLWHENINAASKVLNMKEACVKVKLSF